MATESKRTIGLRLRKLRTQRGLMQAKLAIGGCGFSGVH